MPKYTILIGIDDGPDRYQEVTEPIEAPDPRAAAQVVIGRGVIHPDDQFPQILVIEESQVGLFTRDDDGQAVTDEEDFPRLLEHGPTTVGISIRPAISRGGRLTPAARGAAARRGSPARNQLQPRS